MGLRFLKILFFLGTISSLSAQQVYWKGSQEALTKDQNSILELVFEDCQPENNPQLPNIDGLAFDAPSSSSEYAMENFKITQRAVLSYPIKPLRPGIVIIPAFQVETSAGSLIVPALTLQIEAANSTQGQTPPLNDIVLSQIRPAKKSVWLGEIFDLDYILLVSPRYHAELAGALQWSPDGLALEDWSSPTQVRAQVGNESRQGVQYVTRACALKSGLITPNPAQQKLNLQTGTQRFGFFSRPKLEQFSVESEPFTLEVKPLPASPNDFLNAVGKFKLTSRLVPKKVTVGEPITWTLELSGTGNWPAGLYLPQREVASDFRAIEPKSKLTKPEGKPFEGVLAEDVILIPTKPGNYTLGPIHYSYFDPELGSYVTLSLESEIIEVQPAANNPLAFSSPTPVSDTPSPVSIQNGFVLPTEPIEKKSFALQPMSPNFFYFSTSSLLICFAFWISLAFRRSKITDPFAPQKEAKTKLLELLEQAKTLSAEEISNWLIEWRRYALQYLNLSTSLPSAQEIEEKVNALSQPSTGKVWHELWQETEQALFSTQSTLSTEWPEKAHQAIHLISLPRHPFWTLFLPRNFFPVFLTLSLFFTVSLSAQNPFPELQLYRSGDFKGAEKQLLEKIKQRPNDWATRNNLGLTLAQQERWPEAVAHWTAGRLLNPRNSALHWNMSLGLKRSNFSTPQLSTLAQLPNPFFLYASPAEWQWLFLIALITLTWILSLLLWQRYNKNKKFVNPVKTVILIFLIAGFSLALFSCYSWRRYDLLAQPTAGLVWQNAQLRSIPTDAEPQASHEIEAGTVATVNKTFLSWLKITLPNQESGWIRKNAFVYFYKAS